MSVLYSRSGPGSGGAALGLDVASVTFATFFSLAVAFCNLYFDALSFFMQNICTFFKSNK